MASLSGSFGFNNLDVSVSVLKGEVTDEVDPPCCGFTQSGLRLQPYRHSHAGEHGSRGRGRRRGGGGEEVEGEGEGEKERRREKRREGEREEGRRKERRRRGGEHR